MDIGTGWESSQLDLALSFLVFFCVRFLKSSFYGVAFYVLCQMNACEIGQVLAPV
jgi:hypothetical protein